MVAKTGDSNDDVTGSNLLELLAQEHPEALETIREELGEDESVFQEFFDFFSKKQAKKEGRDAIKVANYLISNDSKYATAWKGVVADATARLAEGFDLKAVKKTAVEARSAQRKADRAKAKEAAAVSA